MPSLMRLIGMARNSYCPLMIVVFWLDSILVSHVVFAFAFLACTRHHFIHHSAGSSQAINYLYLELWCRGWTTVWIPESSVGGSAGSLNRRGCLAFGGTLFRLVLDLGSMTLVGVDEPSSKWMCKSTFERAMRRGILAHTFWGLSVWTKGRQCIVVRTIGNLEIRRRIHQFEVNPSNPHEVTYICVYIS